MAAGREEVLVDWMEKKLYDMRGSQANIVRLAAFDMEGFIHMLSFRILIFVSIIYGIAILLYFVANLVVTASFIKLLTALVWILITPQFFETVKMGSMIGTNGLSFGRFSEEHVFLAKSKNKVDTRFFDIMPYCVMAIWIVGFVAMLIWWSI